MSYQPGIDKNVPFERPCEDRYQILKDQVFSKYQRPFSVLDFGANMGYFGRRAIEDGLPVTYVGIDIVSGKRGIWLKYRFTPEQVVLLSQCEDFDVVLGLSVLHWFSRWQIVMDALINCGREVVIEVPNTRDRGATGQHVIGQIDGYINRHCNPKLLAKVPCHTSSYMRPIYLLEGKQSIIRRYVDWPGQLEPQRVKIASTYTTKTIQVANRAATPFVHGINLRTWQMFGGTWPEATELEKSIRQNVPVKHDDYRPWNIIITAKGIALIDNNWYGNTTTMPVEEIIQGLYGRGQYAI